MSQIEAALWNSNPPRLNARDVARLPQNDCQIDRLGQRKTVPKPLSRDWQSVSAHIVVVLISKQISLAELGRDRQSR
jgi:hypothetical protein